MCPNLAILSSFLETSSIVRFNSLYLRMRMHIMPYGLQHAVQLAVEFFSGMRSGRPAALRAARSAPWPGARGPALLFKYR